MRNPLQNPYLVYKTTKERILGSRNSKLTLYLNEEVHQNLAVNTCSFVCNLHSIHQICVLIIRMFDNLNKLSDNKFFKWINEVDPDIFHKGEGAFFIEKNGISKQFNLRKIKDTEA